MSRHLYLKVSTVKTGASLGPQTVPMSRGHKVAE